ncbi:MAG: hypothetical protein ACREPM_16525 [Gemmatimonadaceae bacterium]
MWRWILGILAVVILALVGTCYAGYRRLTTGGTSVAATVPGDPAHVFTLLTNRDSLLDWLPAGTTAMPERHGTFQPGDTIRVAMPTRTSIPAGRSMQLWIVREVKSPDVFAIEAIEFDPGGTPHPAFTRRDSVFASGDSTRIVSEFVVTPMLSRMDPAAAANASGGVTGSLLSSADKLRVGAARLMWQNQLQRLGRR